MPHAGPARRSAARPASTMAESGIAHMPAMNTGTAPTNGAPVLGKTMVRKPTASTWSGRTSRRDIGATRA